MNCEQLQQMNNRKISIITNFGCRANCWYCIWKNHKLEHTHPDTDWVKLEQFLEQYKDKGKVSLSGGGDCLYKFDQIRDWWNKFIPLIESKHMLLDVHTREKFLDFGWIKNHINRVVFSSDHLDIPNHNISKVPDRQYLKVLSKFTKIRIVHLITKNTSIGMIEDYLNFQQELNCQFTIKQLVNYDDGGMYQLIREKFPDIFHLDDGDYNIYYMPDNLTTTKFIE